jgi:hypothetical protein
MSGSQGIKHALSWRKGWRPRVLSTTSTAWPSTTGPSMKRSMGIPRSSRSAYPRAQSHRQVPAEIRARLTARAVAGEVRSAQRTAEGWQDGLVDQTRDWAALENHNEVASP